MKRKALIRQTLLVESLLLANLNEVAYVKSYEDPDWKLLNSYYVAGRALAAYHIEILKQLGR